MTASDWILGRRCQSPSSAAHKQSVSGLLAPSLVVRCLFIISLATKTHNTLDLLSVLKCTRVAVVPLTRSLRAIIGVLQTDFSTQTQGAAWSSGFRMFVTKFSS